MTNVFDTYFLLCDIIKATPIHSFSHFYFQFLTVMARTAANKAEKPGISEINWSANISLAVWALLAEIEKNENYCVLYGKKDVAEVSLSIPSA